MEDRFGRGEPTSETPVWIHAASVGEVNSAAVLIPAMRARWPKRALRLTAFTATGCARWLELAQGMERVTVAPLPLDHPVWVARALDAIAPQALVIVETEIWPNFLQAAHERNIPVVMVSARISQRSVKGWERWLGRRTLQLVLAPITHVGAQSQLDADRFLRLGAKRVAVDGSLKWDAAGAKPDQKALELIETALQGRKCWLAASTHEGEEAVLLDAHARLLKVFPDLCLILAPRHPRRADTVQELCDRRSFALARRSRQSVRATDQVWLVDTLGELTAFMAAADVVFMGGSLVPVGGHNLLEPAACRVPIVTGTQAENAVTIAQALEAADALIRAGDVESITAAITGLLENPEAAHAQASRAEAVLESGAGAVSRALFAIAAQLPE